MRVEFSGSTLYKFMITNKFTKEMIYRISGYGAGSFYILDDNGYGMEVSENEIGNFFTPYEKPKEGENYWYISADRNYPDKWLNSEEDNNLWDLGLAFKEKKQAEFARERLSKLF